MIEVRKGQSVLSLDEVFVSMSFVRNEIDIDQRYGEHLSYLSSKELCYIFISCAKENHRSGFVETHTFPVDMLMLKFVFHR